MLSYTLLCVPYCPYNNNYFRTLDIVSLLHQQFCTTGMHFILCIGICHESKWYYSNKVSTVCVEVCNGK